MSTDNPVTPERLINAYMDVRQRRTELKQAFDMNDGQLKAKLEKLEVALLKAMQDAGTDQLKVKGVGLAFRTTKVVYRVDDWEQVLAYIEETGNLDLLQRRLAERAVKELADTGDGVLPPGVITQSEIVVNVRKA